MVQYLKTGLRLTTAELAKVAGISARTQQGLTIEQAAALSGVSLGTFVAAENKTATLKLATVFKILNSLGVQLRAQLQNTPTGGNDGWF